MPRLDDYAWRLWDYWERHLDPDLFIDRSLKGKIEQVVVITGGSSGIGLSPRSGVAEAGAITIIVARGEEELFKARDAMKKAGGKVFAYTADLADMAGCDRPVATILQEHGHVDVRTINNAGRSIRRSIEASYDRFHDFERTMQLNYFGSIRLIMGFMPTASGTAAQPRHQHQLDWRAGQCAAFLRLYSLEGGAGCVQSLRAGRLRQGHQLHRINMPLVKTPMIAPTKMYDSVPTLSPDEAADLVVKGIIERPSRIATRLGIFSA